MKSWIGLFLQLSAILFAGFVLCNMATIIIYNGFDWHRLCELPYPLYLAFSLVIAAVLTFSVRRKTQ